MDSGPGLLSASPTSSTGLALSSRVGAPAISAVSEPGSRDGLYNVSTIGLPSGPSPCHFYFKQLKKWRPEYVLGLPQGPPTSWLHRAADSQLVPPSLAPFLSHGDILLDRGPRASWRQGCLWSLTGDSDDLSPGATAQSVVWLWAAHSGCGLCLCAGHTAWGTPHTLASVYGTGLP